jgi:ankyrin repeat protein
MMKDWINSRTFKESFTPLHFASFKGNLKCIYLLLENNADITAENSFGLTMMHVAAQGDSQNPFISSKKKV